MDYTQLIERLKDADAEEVMTTPICEDAADAIEALQAELTNEHMNCLMLEGSLKTLQAQVNKLSSWAGGGIEVSLDAWKALQARVLELESVVEHGAIREQKLKKEFKRVCSEGENLAAQLAALEGQLPVAQPLTDDFVHKVVRLVQPDLADDSDAWADEFCECKYWLKAAHKIGGSV
jgi:chromosome segregation ATPase